MFRVSWFLAALSSIATSSVLAQSTSFDVTELSCVGEIQGNRAFVRLDGRKRTLVVEGKSVPVTSVGSYPLTIVSLSTRTQALAAPENPVRGGSSIVIRGQRVVDGKTRGLTVALISAAPSASEKAAIVVLEEDGQSLSGKLECDYTTEVRTTY